MCIAAVADALNLRGRRSLRQEDHKREPRSRRIPSPPSARRRKNHRQPRTVDFAFRAGIHQIPFPEQQRNRDVIGVALQQAESLTGSSGQQADSLAGLRLRAYFVFARSDAKAEAKMMAQAQALGDDRLGGQVQQALEQYLAAALAPVGTA